MSSEKISWRASVETYDQFLAALEEKRIELIYIDSGYFPPEDYRELSHRAHESGKLIGLRMPYIFRKRAELFFDQNLDSIREAGFDLFLHRNLESYGYLRERFEGAVARTAFDHSIYDMNELTEAGLSRLCEISDFDICLPLELSEKELRGFGTPERGVRRELLVYGHIPMMVSAQCINATKQSCDKKERLLYITDRTGRRLPVKNCCRFCYNVILNPLPICLFDREEELSKIKHSIRRFELTTETRREASSILAGEKSFGTNEYTLSWFRRGVQ